MKNIKNFILVGILLGFSLSVKSQSITDTDISSFRYDINGLYPKFVVMEIDSINQSELFEKTINWIKENYKNPDEVIKTTIGNEKIRFVGFQDGIIELKTMGMASYYGVTYTIEIEFKDGKYRFIPGNCEYRVPVSQYGGGQTVVIDWNNGLQWHNNGKVRKMYQNIPSNIENLLNNLNDNLFNYLSSKTGLKKEDW